MTVDETNKLETCICGQLEAQSFSLWAIAAIFDSLKDSGAGPQDDSFGNLVTSPTLSLQSQAKASFSANCFLQQKRRETFVSHLPASTHASVKYELLATPSSPSLFVNLMIKESFTQMKEDTNLAVLKNLSFAKGGKQSASAASSSGTRLGLRLLLASLETPSASGVPTPVFVFPGSPLESLLQGVSLFSGEEGLHQGHGSCLTHSPSYGDQVASLPR